MSAVVPKSEILADYYSEAELPISSRTARDYRRRGEGPPWIKFFGKVYYPKAGLTQWLKSIEQQPHGRALRRRDQLVR